MSFPQPDDRLLVPSVARALDEARTRIDAAWDHHERPQYLLCNAELFEVIARSKRRETDRGRPLRVLGLLVVREPGLLPDQIDVR